MALFEPPDNNQPEQPSFLRASSIELIAGATFKQARDHLLLCQYVDSLTATQIAELKQITKQMSALYTNMQITVSSMAKQDFGFPTNIDGV
jgi:hypothetical protein